MTKAQETKKAATTNKTTKKATTKIEKVNAEKKGIDMVAINAMLTEAGVKIFNPEGKGNYRIFGSKKGSSLNVQRAAYIIYSTDDDFKAVVDAKIKEVETTEAGNAQDKVRPNVVRTKSIDVLKELLAVYAKNPVNQA